jgi:hypothetical protein
MTCFYRSSFLHLSAAVSAAAAFQGMSEPMLAAAARTRLPHSKDAILIDSNENPLDWAAARDAVGDYPAGRSLLRQSHG